MPQCGSDRSAACGWGRGHRGRARGGPKWTNGLRASNGAIGCSRGEPLWDFSGWRCRYGDGKRVRVNACTAGTAGPAPYDDLWPWGDDPGCAGTRLPILYNWDWWQCYKRWWHRHAERLRSAFPYRCRSMRGHGWKGGSARGKNRCFPRRSALGAVQLPHCVRCRESPLWSKRYLACIWDAKRCYARDCSGAGRGIGAFCGGGAQNAWKGYGGSSGRWSSGRPRLRVRKLPAGRTRARHGAGAGCNPS